LKVEVRKEGKGDTNNDREHKQKGWEVNSVERRKGDRGAKWITEKSEVLKQKEIIIYFDTLACRFVEYRPNMDIVYATK